MPLSSDKLSRMAAYQECLQREKVDALGKQADSAPIFELT